MKFALITILNIFLNCKNAIIILRRYSIFPGWTPYFRSILFFFPAADFFTAASLICIKILIKGWSQKITPKVYRMWWKWDFLIIQKNKLLLYFFFRLLVAVLPQMVLTKSSINMCQRETVSQSQIKIFI